MQPRIHVLTLAVSDLDRALAFYRDHLEGTVTYEFALPDGRILRTRISHPVDRRTYGPSLWSHILRDQLQVSEPDFWSCVRDGVKPDRGMPDPPAEALPADLAYLLIHRVGLPDSEVAAMSKAEAVERLNRYWAEGR
jgi:catechol 2,3-dioxygenase-like lactoylglutathione lyase family enzyme